MVARCALRTVAVIMPVVVAMVVMVMVLLFHLAVGR